NRTNFLANPRLEANRLAQICKDTELVFDINPKIISFDKYVIGKVYESTFEIRNTSTVAHQFRAVPPKKLFFSLSLGQYPQGQSLIAPGLSAQFNIRFSPDSLCSFEDQILVECSNGSKAVLPLVAKRESPCLTIFFWSELWEFCLKKINIFLFNL
ncbi:Deleted in lung and esophageal cancer 1, partial [Brachionus plicatilis]